MLTRCVADAPIRSVINALQAFMWRDRYGACPDGLYSHHQQCEPDGEVRAASAVVFFGHVLGHYHHQVPVCSQGIPGIGHFYRLFLEKQGFGQCVHQGQTAGRQPNVKRALRRAINTEMTRLTQMVPFLATTGNTTPFIGLFGTVWGIMNSFHGIGQRGSASLAVVAPGISEALIATAAGLAVAIPAVIAFNHFMQKIRVIETELHSFSADFLNILDRDILR
jgi:hypothetical protein